MPYLQLSVRRLHWSLVWSSFSLSTSLHSRETCLPSPSPTQSSRSAPSEEIPNPEVKASDVKSISINTVYKGFFAPGDKCAKSYNEYFGNDDGIGSSSSPCTIKMTFDRNGPATRSIEISRWDKTAKEKRLVEKSASERRGLARTVSNPGRVRSFQTRHSNPGVTVR